MKTSKISKSKRKTSPRNPTPKTAQSRAPKQIEQTFHKGYDSDKSPVTDESGTVIEFHPGYN